MVSNICYFSFCSLFIYYYIAVVSGSKKLVHLLKDQLILVSMDINLTYVAIKYDFT